MQHVPSPGVSWWPVVLKGNLDVGKIHSAGLELHIVEKPETSVTTAIYLFAIDWVRDVDPSSAEAKASSRPDSHRTESPQALLDKIKSSLC
jgi:hypothetical protein